MGKGLLLCVICILVTQSKASGMADQRSLVSYLSDHDNTIIPKKESSPVNVTVSLTLIDILKVDKETGQVDIVAWVSNTWKSNFQWDPARFGNVSNLAIPSKLLWVPDIYAYNGISKMEPLSPDLLVIAHTGDVVYVPSIRISFLCDLKRQDISTNATCELKLGSWVYSGYKMDLINPRFDLSSYFSGSKYEVLGVSAKKETSYYQCCPEPYISLKFVLSFKEQSSRGILGINW
uniref:Soluble acetylcholine binding protein n=1 Tax=Pleurobranchaea californica TaxID=404816 RepID=I1SKH0_9GAST|nr:soluble acetylcholine binding protein [Pleurobranchaea californica]